MFLEKYYHTSIVIKLKYIVNSNWMVYWQGPCFIAELNNMAIFSIQTCTFLSTYNNENFTHIYNYSETTVYKILFFKDIAFVSYLENIRKYENTLDTRLFFKTQLDHLFSSLLVKIEQFLWKCHFARCDNQRRKNYLPRTSELLDLIINWIGWTIHLPLVIQKLNDLIV